MFFQTSLSQILDEAVKNTVIKKRHLSRSFPQKIKLFFGILVGIAIIYYLSFNDYGIIRHFRTKKELQQIKSKIELLEKQQKEINTTIEKLKNDYNYIEQQAREKLGLVKEGEELYIVKKSNSGINLEKE